MPTDKNKKGKVIYITEEMYLKEFTTNGDDERNSMAFPDSTNDSDMANSINKAKQLNPQSDNIMVDTSMFDSTANNNPIQIDVNAKNGQDARTQINNMMTANPSLKTMQANGNLMAKVHMEGELKTKKQIEEEKKLKYLRENSVEMNKKHLQEAFLNGLFDE